MTTIPLEEYLLNLYPDVQTITRELCCVARKYMPGAYELIYHDAVGYSVSDSPFDRICYVAPQKPGYVSFGFFFGASLPDPEQLLIGEGNRLRHVKVWNVSETKNPALEKLVVAAWMQAPESIAKVHAGKRKNNP